MLHDFFFSLHSNDDGGGRQGSIEWYMSYVLSPLMLFQCAYEGEKSDDERFRIQMTMEIAWRERKSKQNLNGKNKRGSRWRFHIYKFSYLHFIVYLHLHKNTHTHARVRCSILSPCPFYVFDIFLVFLHENRMQF